ncbi:MAG: hypothetical protein FRX48_02602 [Lasallia pustulata]|uniref:Isochorismatase-like domain-containing protein n=1 Tax=Lasallia pustulata TaxID=136370 RepID=A0A5M8PYW3_9LECA|nr:MAG: hypothetical protein FRX48_02602 [Lasallia pustulata]
MAKRRLLKPALFICDMQEKFRPAIWEFPNLIATAQKMIKASQILNFPIYATTQSRSRLGETCAELKLDAPDGAKTACHVDKTAFSMWVPEVEAALSGGGARGGGAGIEAHICVTQTTLDLLAHGHKVYAADGVVTTSESFLYECMGDAGIAEFKGIAGLVKGAKETTTNTMQTLCKI